MVSYTSLRDIAQSGLLFEQVMCIDDRPILFEKERMDFLLGVYSRDKIKIKHLELVDGVTLVKPWFRYALHWLYRRDKPNFKYKTSKARSASRVAPENRCMDSISQLYKVSSENYGRRIGGLLAVNLQN